MLESAQTVTETVLTMHLGSTRDTETSGRERRRDGANMMGFVNAELNDLWVLGIKD